MKKLFSKVVTFMLLLAMVVTAVVIPNEETKAADNYYIAGSMQGWDNGNANWKMTQSGSNYVYTITGLEADVLYEFKVTDGGWSNCWPSSNYSFKLNSASDVTVTFNPTTKEITIEGAGLQENADYYICGSLNGWTLMHADYAMTKSGDDYVCTFAVEVGTYEFKVNNGTWDEAYPSSNYSFTAYTAGNVTIKLSSTKEISVTGDPLTPPAVITYYVAGSMNEWAVANEDYKLVKSGSDYVYTGTLAAGEYKFKITDGTWDNAYPESDYVFAVTEESEVTIKLSSDNKVSVAGNKVIPVYYVSGTMNNWEIKDEYKMTVDGTDYVLELTLAAGDYEFKVTNSTWESAFGDTDGNYNLTLTEESKVTVKLSSDNTVTVTPVSTTVPGGEGDDDGNDVDNDEGNDVDNDNIESTGDFSMLLPLVLVLFGGAMVLVASKKRFA